MEYVDTLTACVLVGNKRAVGHSLTRTPSTPPPPPRNPHPAHPLLPGTSTRLVFSATSEFPDRPSLHSVRQKMGCSCNDSPAHRSGAVLWRFANPHLNHRGKFRCEKSIDCEFSGQTGECDGAGRGRGKVGRGSEESRGRGDRGKGVGVGRTSKPHVHVLTSFHTDSHNVPF